MAGYTETYANWQKDPTGFWSQAAGEIDWIKSPDVVLDENNPPLTTWFPDAVCNTCYNAVDRHVVSGQGAQVAIIHDSPVTGSQTKITYDTLLDRVARVAGVLTAQGIKKGDRVIIYMPMIPEALIAMLACARIGAVHSVVFGGFSAHELAVRIDDAAPKAILAASAGIEGKKVIAYKPLLDGAIERADHKPDFTLILQRPVLQADLKPGFDLDWATEEAVASPVGCTPVGGADPLYVLYTSGTTGQPKGVVRHNGGHMVALNWTMKNIYNVKAGDVFWAASDVGWVVGHSYICYGPLLAGCTTVVFEGKPVGTPDAGTFWRVIQDHDVKVLFTAPTALRAIKREDPKAEQVGKYDLSGLQSLFLAGERADPDTIKWAQEHLNIPVIDHWWQTETGWAIAANPLGIEELPVKPGSPAVPMPGYEVDILDEGGNPVVAGELGAIAIKLPLPPGALPTLWNAEERFKSAYLQTFPGYYETGDAGIKDEDGYLYIMARTDDVINVAGHRLSTGAMEEILSNHPDVAECAVIGIGDALKGQQPLGLVCLNNGVDRSEEEIAKECVSLIRKEIGPVAAFKRCIVIDALPKTRSGKVLRGTMVSIADSKPWNLPATIDDPATLDAIAARIAGIGETLSENPDLQKEAQHG
ncbi:propionyl-CoA synthetase [Sulfitobacter sp. M57]|uniref:propionyl-CoA synthetase n=1 Tax=unclassified Sulfitobacter TaxID=196795 RepID=UPI0023E2559B|nr:MULTISPECIES: propionyl-CoA synthetase [unclassified Sulfitobacter]MDF3415072.1 propionyl-CoA synthetase [Sulfitobacter sp. KE5]MDF3422553.1 propionyl-CoA synthetase [Sulfitobacter sp. KE43]MDF3433618.1 propionyl-CoA synthetase [Sulfitobacter sp. KE42]MDF3459258.1 propionyl-CoA synthetase [Sulfitobacter sp. S74]MDF3463157.1 propionyl-CoA synthetase [Sulfitobacter sp. Ks18]